MIELIMKPTGRRDRWGFRQFDLALTNNGKAVDRITIISGTADRQHERFVHPADDWSGSNRSIPEGIYLLGPVERGYWGSAIGEIWISLTPIRESNVNNRSAFGSHADYNRDIPGFQGSAGCVCPYTTEGMERVASWCEQKNKPVHLVVDYSLGFLASIGYEYLVA